MAQRSYELGDAVFGIRTTSHAFCEWLDEALGRYRIDEETDPYFSVVVDGGEENGDSRGRGYHILYRGIAVMVRTLHLPTVGRALFSELEALSFRDREDLLYLDNSLAASGGKTALLPQFMVSFIAGLGQRRVGRAGLSLSAESSVAVEPRSGRVVPVPRTLDVSNDSVEWLGDGSDGQTDRVFVEEPFMPDVVLTHGVAEELDGISRARVLSRLTAGVFNLKRVGRSALEGLGRTIAAAPCHAIPIVDAKETLKAVTASLREA